MTQAVSSRAGLALSPRVVAGFVVTIIYLNLATNWNLVLALMSGTRASDVPGDGTVRLIREGIVFLLAVLAANALIEHKRREHGRFTASRTSVMVAVLLAVEAGRSVLAGSPPGLVLTGLRAVPLLLLLALLPHYGPTALAEILDRVAGAVRWFVVLQGVLVAYQMTSTPETFGRTFAGARAYGTFPAPNNLGMAIIGVMALLVLRRPRGWRMTTCLCLGMAISTGSRTAMVGVLLVLLAGSFARIRLRWLAAFPAGLLVVGLGILFSSSTFSGREIQGEGRLGQWTTLLGMAESPADWLFGLGVGLGSNAAQTTGQAVMGIPDSTLVATFVSFGLTGVVALILGIVRVASRGALEVNLRYLPAALLAGISFNVTEISPLNILVVLLIGAAMPRCSSREVDGPVTAGTAVNLPGAAPPRQIMPARTAAVTRSIS